MTKKEILKYSTIGVNKNQISCDLSGESVILHLEGGVYYGLNETGTVVWNLIQKPKSVNEILDTLLGQFDIEPKQCENDLLKLLNELEEHKLIDVQHETVI